MKTLAMMVVLKVLVLAAFSSFSLSQAQFMDMSSLVYGNLAFDQQFDAQLKGMMMENQQQIQALMQAAAANPQVQADYKQYLAMTGTQIPYEQFLYYWVMTAGGSNPQAGLQAQQNWFNGMQQAHATVQSGFDNFNQGWWQNQASQNRIYDNWSLYTRSQSVYQNPATGTDYTLPYDVRPGTGFDYGGSSFYLDTNSQYYQWDGFGWQPLTPLGW